MPTQDDPLGFLLADVSRLMRRAFQQQLEASGSLTLAQARALAHVARSEGIRQGELADLLEIQPITLTRLIDQLEGRGLVERRPDPHDRRAYQLHLTRAAAPQLKAIRQAAQRNYAVALRGVDPQQADTLRAVLKAMRDNLTGR